MSEMVWYCVLTNFVSIIFNSLSEYVRIAESISYSAFFYLEQSHNMKQFCLHSLTPEICLLILPSSF